MSNFLGYIPECEQIEYIINSQSWSFNMYLCFIVQNINFTQCTKKVEKIHFDSLREEFVIASLLLSAGFGMKRQ